MVDLGLRLEDVRRLGLQSEAVTYRQEADPRRNLIESGATPEEADFLVRRRAGRSQWRGERVELNAMTSRQMIAWLEGKLDEHGVKKLIPGHDDLAAAFARAASPARLRRDVAAFLEERKTTHVALTVPTNLAELVRERIAGTADAWDSAVRELADAALGGEAAS